MNPTRNNITEIALAALESPAHREAKRATQDGLIWPVARHEMTSARRIRERIAEDAKRLIASGETVITTEDFLRIGWQRAQLNAHAAAAMQALNAENTYGNEPFSPEVA